MICLDAFSGLFLVTYYGEIVVGIILLVFVMYIINFIRST